MFFKIMTLRFGISCRLRDGRECVPKLKPEDDGKIFPRKKFLISKITRSKSSLLWDVTQSKLVGSYRRFGATYRSHIQGSSLILEDWTNMLLRNIGNYQSTLRNIPEERRSHLHRGGNLKSCKTTRLSLLETQNQELSFF
jgi:hypothetical protein